MNPIEKAKHEFLLDNAEYFKDKKSLYLEIKVKISNLLPVEATDIRICGSAYWGRSFVKDEPFNPGVSDLDVALISPAMFCKCMTEVREITKNFSDQTSFPATSRAISAYEEFQSYSFKKGIIRADLLPKVRTRNALQDASEKVSREYLDHFEKISFIIYDSSQSFAVKQAGAARKFRNE